MRALTPSAIEPEPTIPNAPNNPNLLDLHNPVAPAGMMIARPDPFLAIANRAMEDWWNTFWRFDG
jgi:hypothetical protein